MATFKLPTRIGEGTRERKPSHYGEGGRSVGGEARRAQLKKGVSAKKGTISLSKKGLKQLPPPGGHPQEMVDIAKAKGFKPPIVPSINRAAERMRANEFIDGAPNGDADSFDDASVGDDSFLDQIFDQKVELVREERTKEQLANRAAKARRLGILKPEAQEVDNGETCVIKGCTNKVWKPTDNAGVSQADDGASVHVGRQPKGRGKKKDTTASAKGRGQADKGAGGSDSQIGSIGSDGLTSAGRKSASGKSGSTLPHADQGAAQKSQAQVKSLGLCIEHRRELGIGGEPTAAALSGFTLSLVQKDQNVAHCSTSPAGETGNSKVDQALAHVESRERSDASKRLTVYKDETVSEMADILAMPGVICNNCPAAEHCPEFKENSACAFDVDFAGLSSRDLDNIIPQMELFADIQKRRALRGYYLEQRVAGGALDPNVTRQIEVAAIAAERVARLKAPQSQTNSRSITVIAKEEGNPQGSLLHRLMAGVTGALPGGQPGSIQINPEPIREVIDMPVDPSDNKGD